MTGITSSAERVNRAADGDVALRSAWFEPSVHSAYYQIFSKLMAPRLPTAPRAFTGQARLLPLLDFLPLLDGVDASRNPDTGAELGWAVQGAAHGPMGLAAM